MSSIPFFEVVAFTNRLFAGSPAGVCLLEQWCPDEKMQAIAAENNLPETAFVLERGDHFELRWMTPKLCGHATLASAHVLFRHRGYAGEKVRFQTQSGELTVERNGDRLVLDFPSRPAKEVERSTAIADSLGAKPEQVLQGRDYFAVFASQRQVAAIRPDFVAVA